MNAVGCIAAAALTCSAAGAFAQDRIAMREQAGIRYACGGVGEEEREALLAFRPQANAELLLVTEKRGGYLAGVSLRVYRSGSDAAPVTIDGAGPICLISAPPGTYRVEATYEGLTRSRTLTIGTAAGRSKPWVLAFPES